MRPDNDCSHGLAQISTMAPDGIRLQQAGLLRVLPAALEVLDNAHALGLLDTLPSNFHLVQCEKARIHSLREECPKALLYSQSALLLQSSKLECL